MYAQPKVNLISIDISIIDRITSITDMQLYKDNFMQFANTHYKKKETR
jgi:hypothetical protein